jgi:t-SNARE complex subunit (syntaxin)
MNFLQNRWIMWGGALVIVLIVVVVLFGLPGVVPPPAQ